MPASHKPSEWQMRDYSNILKFNLPPPKEGPREQETGKQESPGIYEYYQIVSYAFSGSHYSIIPMIVLISLDSLFPFGVSDTRFLGGYLFQYILVLT